MSEYRSLNGSDLLKEVPSLLCSCAGSTRASIAVLSQIEPTPGAVRAAHAVPEDCGWLPPFASFSESSSDAVSVERSRATVISAPIRASQNGDSGCFTDTAAEPFGLSLDDHDISLLAPAWGAMRAFAGRVVRVDASTLSWLQSNSKAFGSASVISRSFASGALASAAGASGLSSAGPACALVCSTDARLKDARLKPAASISSTARPFRVLEVITPPAVPIAEHAYISAQNCGGAIDVS